MSERLQRPFIWVPLLIAIFLLFNVVFVVNQTHQAIVLQFGELQHVHKDPGLKFKIPFIQEVIFYERRVLDLDTAAPVRITTSDQKRLWVDSYTRYKIADPILFFRTIKPATELGARARLEVLVSSVIRNVLGKVPLRNLLSEERGKIMNQIHTEVSHLAKTLGIEIIDVRIIRAELPVENRKAVFARMNSDLYRIAKENRAKGLEISQTIKAEADRDKTVLLAEAQKQSDLLRGEGDAKAAHISAEILGKDPKFYAFYRGLQVYKDTLKEGTTLVLTTDSEVLKFMDGHE